MCRQIRYKRSGRAESCLLVICLLLAGYQVSIGQSGRSGEIGQSFVRLIGPQVYKAHAQNFAVTQDSRGIIYVGNFAGVLQYDGVNWHQINTAQQTRVTAFGRTEEGKLFVGGNNDFGVLAPDKTGQLQYKALTTGVRTDFGEIHTILTQQENTIFFSRQKVFQWNQTTGRTTEWTVDRDIAAAWLSNGVAYVYQPGKGLGRFINGGIVPIRQTARLAGGVSAVLPLRGGNLIVTPDLGLFRLAGENLLPFASSANQLLINGAIRKAITLQSDRLALWSDKLGLVLLSREGELLQVSDYKNQLEGGQVGNLFEDREGNLWLPLDNGVAILNTASPVSYFAGASQVKSILRHKGKLYVATGKGLFYVDKAALRPVSPITWGCWSLAEAGGSLFIGTSNGLYQLVNQEVRQLSSAFSFCVVRSATDPNRLYVGSENSLGQIRVNGASASFNWLPISDRSRSEIGNITEIVDDGTGTVWLSAMGNRLIAYYPESQKSRVYLDNDQKLIDNHLLKSAGRLMLYSADGISAYNSVKDTFERVSTFSGLKTTSWFGAIVEDSNGNVWATDGDQKHIQVYANARIDSARQALLRPLADVAFTVIYPDSDRVVWFGGMDGLVRYDQQFSQTSTGAFPAVIRQIRLNSDSTYFSGFTGNAEYPAIMGQDAKFSSSLNNLTFEFSAASYLPNQPVEFQYFLTNFDKGWSAWSTQVEKEYTNLPPGSYTFRVRARNIYGDQSQEATFSFVIRTPVYLQWWAKTLYALLGIAFVVVILRWRTKRSEKEKQALEKLIEDRTEEIRSQKQELEQQSEELALKNDQLERIDLIVQAINAEVGITNLFRTILERLKIIRNMESAAALIYDPEVDMFRFRASVGIKNAELFDEVRITLNQALDRYLTNADEVFEDIFVQNQLHAGKNPPLVAGLTQPKSLIAIALKAEGRVEGFIILYNLNRYDAFDQRDFNTLRNLKEHLLAAFIKTRILRNLENTLDNLKSTQEELIRQEKLASVGQLTKGIMDRVLNPLNYINNFSQLSNNLITEITLMLEEQKAVIPEELQSDVIDDLELLKDNLSKIQEHGNSTSRIVKDMQKLLREKTTNFCETDLNAFIESKSIIALQEGKKEHNGVDVNLRFSFDTKLLKANILPNELGQAISSIISNSVYALTEKSRSVKNFMPEISVSTKVINNEVQLTFKDNGKGIPAKEKQQLFSPFFTTKPTSKGTGLGLFMTKDIVETHGGRIAIDSMEDEYTEIVISLPVLKEEYSALG
ncbi:hypothetical protein GCM10023189_46010 [Nibrella saemangeumensis]|uniref:histidine kinase n=1 Tax=Nibrella saemangeumensis TaxID=1084526 RepID=A0ABP8NH96_9BACT